MSLQKPSFLTPALSQEINTSYMKIMTAILLIAVCFYSVSYFRTQSLSSDSYSITTPVSTDSNHTELPIYSVEREDAVIALTFDAAWGDEDLDDILTILDQHQAKATFFVSGDWVSDYPDAIQSIHAAGHELANHGTHHKHMPLLSTEEMTKEIMTCHQQVYALTQTNMTAFRAPYSDWNGTVVATAQSCGYASINQNVDSVDWKDYGVENIIQTVLNDPDLDNGAIILLHNGAKYTAQALDELLTQLENKGYSFVTISELIYHDNYRIDHTGRQFPITRSSVSNSDSSQFLQHLSDTSD